MPESHVMRVSLIYFSYCAFFTPEKIPAPQAYYAATPHQLCFTSYSRLVRFRQTPAPLSQHAATLIFADITALYDAAAAAAHAERHFIFAWLPDDISFIEFFSYATTYLPSADI